MLTMKKIILCGIGYCRSCRRWLPGAPMGVAMLLGLFLFGATTAQAIPVQVNTLFQGGGAGNPTVATEAFFDDAARGGPSSGSVNIQLDRYTMLFSNFGPAVADLSAPPNPLFARFNDGVFRFIFGGQVPFISALSPPNFANLFVAPPGDNRLILRFRISGRNNFSLVSSSGIIALTQTTNVPEPGALALFGVGLFGIAAVARRRKKLA